MIIHTYLNDIPDDVLSYFKNDKPRDEAKMGTGLGALEKLKQEFSLGSSIAIDTEAMGLKPYRDRLCLVQMSKGDGEAHLVQFDDFSKSKNLRNLLEDKKVTKIFHYARFDVMMMYKYLGVMTNNIYCTKIASRLVRTYTNKHSLQELCSELLGVYLAKEQTCTDWGKRDLNKQQKEYAANDVLYLHKIRDKLDLMLIREDRMEIANACFDFLKTRIKLDLLTDETYDIFAHHSLV